MIRRLHIEFSHIKKLLVAFIVVAFFALLVASSAYLQGIVTEIVDAFELFVQESPVTSKLFFFALAAASVLIGPFTSAPLVPLAIAGWGIADTLIIVFLGWMAGDILAYVIGRFAGRPSVSFVVGRERLEHWIEVLRPRMKFSFLLLFRFAMPAETGYIFGILSYDFWKYMLITAIAEAPLVFLVVYAGGAFLGTDWLTFGALLLVGVLGIFVVYRMFLRRFRLSIKA